MTFTENKKVECAKLKASNSLFETIKNDLEAKKKNKIEDYEEYYKEAQESSKGKLD